MEIQFSDLNRHNLKGFSFGKWIVKSPEIPVIAGGRKRIMYVCHCECGNKSNVFADALLRGTSQSCGCLRIKQIRKRSLKHGHAQNRKQTRTYQSWLAILNRCSNPKDTGFKNYGGRGIKVCNRWQGEHGFENFLADMGEKPKGLTIERINNNGDYEPGNCRWATRKEQNRNKRNNLLVWHEGRYITITELAEKLSITYYQVKKLLINQSVITTRRD